MGQADVFKAVDEACHFVFAYRTVASDVDKRGISQHDRGGLTGVGADGGLTRAYRQIYRVAQRTGIQRV